MVERPNNFSLYGGFHSFQERWKSRFPEFTIITNAQSVKNSSIFCIPWQAIEVLHICSCTPSPRQNVPLFAGLGLSHVRVLVWIPQPHVLLQVVQADQELHMPSTIISPGLISFSDMRSFS